MPNTLTARSTKFAEYCVRHRITRVDVVAADLIPKRGVAKLQSTAVRQLARDAFRGPRARQRDL